MADYIIIPVRYDSSRLPGKALLDLCGKPMVQRVYESACKTKIKNIIVATDNEKVAACVNSFGGEVCMTSTQHRSGTERIAEAIDTLGLADHDVVINMQGDECFVPAEVIHQLLDDFEQETMQVSTLCEPIKMIDEIFDPNVVKIVMDQQGFALYFSRAPVPWDRATFDKNPDISADYIAYRHIGIYGYRAGLIRRYVQLTPSPLEKIEFLEQLRLLWHGEKIHVLQASKPTGIGIDTPTDLELARQMITNR